ncbi:MAG TPA: NADH-quinone oxidoreductase subunit NuoH [Bryobacterales bacterium]|jgi:NADH-quinone oxidoreductase subunit H|nr:NADH-quinone oxidoreductase subunit NuoH [Bryobacterales bacterium]
MPETAALLQIYLKPLILTAVIILVFPLVAGYIVLAERKVLADFQVRLGPMRVGPYGFLQPLADAVKLLLKEDIIPSAADRWIFWLAPVLSTVTALAAFSVLPLGPGLHVADVNIGLLVILAFSSVGILGIILGGWASNSHYSLLGSLRSAAQMVSYEVAMGFAIVSGLMVAGTLSMEKIIQAQQERHIWFAFANYGLMLVPFVTYSIAAVAETNRAPFDLPEAESELVAGFHTEYSGFRWSLYFLAEYANMFVVSSIAVTLFLGGWLRPFPSIAALHYPLDFGFPALLFGLIGFGCAIGVMRRSLAVDKAIMAALAGAMFVLAAAFLAPAVNQAIIGVFWFLFKVSVILYCFIWYRGTFPRYRYDQLMRVGWRYMIPIGLGSLIVNGVVLLLAQR